ncbi:MAG: ABC transporter ATP-binding protein [Acidobacteriota bacterium]|nr:ABC transporter ATP-binding protein [Acidobacteriota bacterium]
MFTTTRVVDDRVCHSTALAEDTASKQRPVPAAAAPIAELRNVTKTFATAGEDITALKDVTLTVERGEILAMVGPSGCGKSTLMNMVAGFSMPTTGEVFVNGRPLSGLNRLSTLMPQSDSLFPWMSIRENVRYGCEGGDEPGVDEYLRAVDLLPFANRWPRELSSGMRKRAEVARAYASGAEILLLDEPFGALDVLTKEAMQVLLQDVWLADQRTILFITHDVEEALFVSHRVAVLSPRPGTVRRIVPVPFAFPRKPLLKVDAEFVAHRRLLMQTLRGSNET